MGSCISKCKPKEKHKEDCIHVQDKLIIISQNPISSIPPNITTMHPKNLKYPLPPAPSNSSTASYSSFSCSPNTSKRTVTSSSLSSSASSLSTCSSSISTGKDRSFSNEFLWSCVKENPHIISHNHKTKNEDYSPRNIGSSSSVASPLVKTEQSVRKKATNNVPTPKKRARASSPTLVRQKSFRREHDSNQTPNRALSSPSPSRRFINGDTGRYVRTNGTPENNSSRHQIVPKGNNAFNPCPKREKFRASPNRGLATGRNSPARKKDVLISQQVSGKIDDHVGVGGVKDRQEMDTVMEDVNNPLIALDCFIFL